MESKLIPLLKKTNLTKRQAQEYAMKTFNTRLEDLNEEQIDTWAKTLKDMPF